MTHLHLILRMFVGLALAMAAAAGPAVAQSTETAVPPLSSTAERIYAAAQPALLQIRTLVAAAGRQSSVGSGFLVSERGIAVTNYHVVSQYALEPEAYRLEYAMADGGHGRLRLLAIDLADDLALVRLEDGVAPGTGLAFDTAALGGSLPQGERLYSMGNPLDLGFTIVEGTYNGLVEHSYDERIHFSGALNPGMSGGPAVASNGRVVGINVAKQLNGELVSFLVPARFAAALLARARDAAAPTPTTFRAEIGAQLASRQDGLYGALARAGFRASAFGPYEAGESAAPWLSCWGHTNAGQTPKPRATVDSTSCTSGTQLFIANDLSTGLVQLTHSYVRSVDLNAFQFAAFLAQQAQPGSTGWSRKWQTPQRCHEDFLAADSASDSGGATAPAHPTIHALWCARAYRAFANLYDVSVTAITEESGGEALISRLSLRGVDFDNAMALSRRFLEAVRWTRKSG